MLSGQRRQQSSAPTTEDAPRLPRSALAPFLTSVDQGPPAVSFNSRRLQPSLSIRSKESSRSAPAPSRLSTVRSSAETDNSTATATQGQGHDRRLADELDFVTINPPSPSASALQLVPRSDKASRVLGIQHNRSMEPIPASTRTSLVSTRSAREAPPPSAFTPTLPLTSLYVVSGLPKAPHTWTLADPDSVLGLAHSEGAVNRWWRAEVLGSTVSPGVGGGKKKKRGKGESEVHKGAGALGKQEVAKMLSKALKLSFTREVEIIASTLQPASTVHTFSFTLPAPTTALHASSSAALLRQSILSTTSAPDTRPTSMATSLYPYNDPFINARPSSAVIGQSNIFPPNASSSAHGHGAGASANTPSTPSSTVTYHGVCLTVWSHADAERSAAIRRTLEANRSRKESSNSLANARLRSLRSDGHGSSLDPTAMARRSTKRSARVPWGATTDGETDIDADTDAMSESDFEVASTINGGHNPGESTLFLPGDTVFWLPYALTLVSRHPIYDLMRDYLTLSWARFSKDVQSHTLQISKILSHPAPRAGDLIRLDASASVKTDASGLGVNDPDTSLEVVTRFPGGLDFGRGLVDVNFTMWPLFKALNIDNILTICEIALAPTGRILFFSRHPAMLGIAVLTIKYLVELRGWNGVALQSVHARDAKIYIDDPGPWIIGLATEARYCVRPPPEVCVCDLDINYLNCAAPPPGVISVKQQRERFRKQLMTAFEPLYHPDHSVPSEFKEAFPAGRFRPVCKIQAKRGGASAAVADTIKPPEWWHSTRIIQAFDMVLQDKLRKPSLLKRISSFGSVRRQPQLSAAEQHIQLSIRKRATAFVDARDDLETKIGRLSRRLNFLMTESDLWRDKFVTFEQYAEKLSVEAGELRARINKEQRETKRLSGLVTLTAGEKHRLESQLRDTEGQHKDALDELQKMKQAMETMEVERAAMVAEVEAQIEQALASMAVGMNEGDYESDGYDSGSARGSRPSSRNARSRRPSDAGSRIKQLRSFATETTLAEYGDDEQLDGEGGQDVGRKTDLQRYSAVIEEGDESEEAGEGGRVSADGEAATAKKTKRFSSSMTTEAQQDGMKAVDEGISERSDRIARKVLEIQQKLENALAAEYRERDNRLQQQSSTESGSEMSEARYTPRRRAQKGAARVGGKARKGSSSRNRSGGNTPSGHVRRSSENSRRSDSTEVVTPTKKTTETTPRNSASGMRPTVITSSDAPATVVDDTISTDPDQQHGDQSSIDSRGIRKISSGASLGATRPATPPAPSPSTPALTNALTGTTDDSDTDFQSAYSASPRAKYGDAMVDDDHLEDFGGLPPPGSGRFRSESESTEGKEGDVMRERVSSVVTVKKRSGMEGSPTFSDHTVGHPRPSRGSRGVVQ